MIEAKSGQQKAEENLLILEAWMDSKTDQDFKRYVYRGQLSRTEIATECKFAKSVLTQNPRVRTRLAEKENELRVKGILPQLVGAENQQDLGSAATTKADDSRMKRLECENAILRAELDRFRKIERLMADTMRTPR